MSKFWHQSICFRAGKTRVSNSGYALPTTMQLSNDKSLVTETARLWRVYRAGCRRSPSLIVRIISNAKYRTTKASTWLSTVWQDRLLQLTEQSTGEHD